MGFLRFVGLMNAAIWFGAAIFYCFGAAPVLQSEALKTLIGSNNFPYYGFAIQNLVAASFFHLHVACGIVCVLHLMAEWLYFGKYPRKVWVLFILALLLAGGLQGLWVQPRLKLLHDLEHGRQARPEERQLAARGFKTWSSIAWSLDALLALGVGFYVWRTANPPDPMRFVSASKFRS